MEKWKGSLDITEKNCRDTISIVEQNQGKFPEIMQSFESFSEGARDIKIDVKDSSNSQKRIQEILNFLPNIKKKIISRLNSLYSKSILSPNYPFLFSLEHVKFMDKHFLKAFENEEDFLNLLKCNNEVDKRRALKLRNDSPKYALNYVYAMKIPEERGQPKYSPNWKGLFCTCSYYLMRDYFKDEFKENCPTQADFIKFFGIGKKNFIYYLGVFRRAHLKPEIFQDKSDFFELKGL